jgi:hypothetical protein
LVKAAKIVTIGALILFGLITALILFVSMEESVPIKPEETAAEQAEPTEPAQGIQENTDTVDEALSGKFTKTFQSEFASNDGVALFDRVEVVPGQYFAKVYSTVASTDEDEVRQLAVNKLGSMTVNLYYTDFRDHVDLNDVRIYGSDGKDLGYTFSDLHLSSDQR